MKHTIGMTSGAFDMLHPGHVYFLNQCKKLCNELIVLVAPDKLTTSKKPPIFNEEQRKYVLEHLQSVDWVLFEDNKKFPNNIKRLLKMLTPDMYITNVDNPHIEEYRELCDKLDIMFIVLKRNNKGIFNVSTSEIINKINRGY